MGFIIFILGFYHGINPSMGWLLAASLGIKKKSRHSLILSLLFLTLGHLIAIAFIIFGAAFLEIYIPKILLGWITVALLIGFGIYHLLKQSHPTWFGLDVGFFQMTLWSFLIASAHGAGLMLLPFILGENRVGFIWGSALILIHTLGYFIAATIAAFILFESMRLAVLNKVWINFDLIWAISLLITAAFFIFMYL